MKYLHIATAAAYWLSNFALAAESKGYLGIKIVNTDGNENGIGGSKRPKRKLSLASKSAEKVVDGTALQHKRTSRNRVSRRTRGGMMHVTEIFVDDDSEIGDDTIHPLDDDYSDDYLIPDSTGASSKRENRKGMMMMSKSSKHHDVDYDFYPHAKDLGFVDDQFFDDQFFEDDDCELVTFNETFGMLSADKFMAPDTTMTNPGDPDYPGTVFMFERDYLLDPDGTSPINGTYVSGTCTRTVKGSKAGSGAGVCSFVFVDDEGYSVNVNGLLVGPLGGKLAITGGTGGMVGVIGDMDFLPIFEGSQTVGDIFMAPIRYEVVAHLGLIVCP